ncbi:MAG: helix-turn-helix transcriptional regulator [Raoultibacter sp.]|jgi:DNA-binding CsgD family transcriptional regulator
MSEGSSSRGLSPRRIAGFACNQGFVFFLFYIGLTNNYALGNFHIERADLIGTLFFMVLGFVFVRVCPKSLRSVLGSRPFLLVYALFLSAGSLIPLFVESLTLFWLVLESALLGLSCALMLSAWGRAFGKVSTKTSIPEVFLGSLLGALFGLVASFVPLAQVDLAFRALPFVSAFALLSSANSGFDLKSAPMSDVSTQAATLLSFKIVAGTALFGIAAGLMEVFYTEPGMQAIPTFVIAFLLFVAFALGTLTTLLSDSFGRGTSLNKAYRLAVFIMLVGLFLVPTPVFTDSIVTGEAIVLAGYLGLSAVLISLFLVLANITNTSTSASFSRGFAALFAGELFGVLLGNAFFATHIGPGTPYTAIVLAGVLILVSYIFLFTERDFDELSEIVTDTDSFDQRCAMLSETYGLSNRESEILPFALKGRTSERISQELFISKSTVDTHLRRIYRKMEVHSKQELIDLSERTD